MKFILIAAILVAAAYAFDEATFTEEPDDVFLTVHSTLDAMKKRGATESDCKDLAKTSCKEVERERSTNQKMLDKLQDGSKCPPLGQKTVKKAWAHYTNAKNSWNSSKQTLSNARNKRVTFSSQRYNTMTKGNCGFVFSSRNYINAKRALDNAVKSEAIWKGKTSGAHKAWKVAVAAAAKLKHNCLCDAKVSARKLWSTVGNAKLIKKQNRAHTKCKMMSCVLKGTNARAAKCQGSLPALRNKVLTTTTTREKCPGDPVARKAWHTLYSGLQMNDKSKKNTWSGWYTKGNNGYSTVKVDQVQFHCGSNTLVKYKLNNGYKGRTLLSIVKGCGLHAGSRNNNRGRWKAGHCTNVGSLMKNQGVNGATNLRIGVGDGSTDAPDWAVFMFVAGNGRGDFHGSKIWDFGGETQMNDARRGQTCSITGYGTK